MPARPPPRPAQDGTHQGRHFAPVWPARRTEGPRALHGPPRRPLGASALRRRGADRPRRAALHSTAGQRHRPPPMGGADAAAAARVSASGGRSLARPPSPPALSRPFPVARAAVADLNGLTTLLARAGTARRSALLMGRCLDFTSRIRAFKTSLRTNCTIESNSTSCEH